MPNYKPEVLVGGKWCQNALVFATREEAEDNAKALMFRWFAVLDSRAVESDDPITYHWDKTAQQLVRLEKLDTPTIVGEGAIHPVPDLTNAEEP